MTFGIYSMHRGNICDLSGTHPEKNILTHYGNVLHIKEFMFNMLN